MDLIFLRLGHLGEIHLAENEDNETTFCGIPCQGPNFSQVAPVDLAPRPSPQLCTDCKDELDKRESEDEDEATDEE